MDIFDREWCDAWVWTPRGAGLFRIARDRAYWASCYEVCLPPSGYAHVALKQGTGPLHAHELQPNTKSRATELVQNTLTSPAMKLTWV